MNTQRKHILMGFALGILFPLLCFALYAKYRFPDVPLTDIYKHVQTLKLTWALLSLCVFTNLALFFLFLWQNRDSISRGILTATFLYAVVVAFLKLTG